MTVLSEAPPEAKKPAASGMMAMIRHTQYVLAENPVTAGSFALFIAFLIAAILGPSLVPYDPLASDTAAALQAPSAHHWFGTDQLGRDILSRVVVAECFVLLVVVVF